MIDDDDIDLVTTTNGENIFEQHYLRVQQEKRFYDQQQEKIFYDQQQSMIAAKNQAWNNDPSMVYNPYNQNMYTTAAPPQQMMPPPQQMIPTPQQMIPPPQQQGLMYPTSRNPYYPLFP